MALAMTSLPVPVSPSMRTVESVGATVRTRSSVSIRPVLHPTIPSNACCLERFSLAKLMLAKVRASGKAIPGLPILHPPAPSLHSVHDIHAISETLFVLELEYGTNSAMRTTLDRVLTLRPGDEF